MQKEQHPVALFHPWRNMNLLACEDHGFRRKPVVLASLKLQVFGFPDLNPQAIIEESVKYLESRFRRRIESDNKSPRADFIAHFDGNDPEKLFCLLAYGDPERLERYTESFGEAVFQLGDFQRGRFSIREIHAHDPIVSPPPKTFLKAMSVIGMGPEKRV